MTEQQASAASPDDDDDGWPAPPDPLAEMANGIALFVATRELMHDARTIMQLGSGLYELDLLKHQLRHSLRYLPPLKIGTNLKARLNGALQDIGKSWDDLTQATVSFTAKVEERDPAKGYKPANVFGRYTGLYVLCRMEINVMLATVNDQYPAFHRGQVDWPRDWDRLGL